MAILVEWREKMINIFDKRIGKKQTIEYVRKWSFGKIIELGCGENPVFSHSTKADIRKFPNCLKFDLNYPFPINEKFDTIVALEVIEHLWNTDNFLKECHRILKKNGILLLSTPNIKWWKNRIKLLLGIVPELFDEDKYKKEYGYTGHLRFYSPEHLKRVLEGHNFTFEEWRPIGRVWLREICGDFIVRGRKRLK